MNFQLFGDTKAPTLLLIPGLGVSYEIFLPLIRLTEDRFRIIAAEVDGFTLGKHTRFTSVDDQAAQVIDYVKTHKNGHLDGAYGLSLGGKILSRILERNEVVIDHAILDAAPLLPVPILWVTVRELLSSSLSKIPLRRPTPCNSWLIRIKDR